MFKNAYYAVMLLIFVAANGILFLTTGLKHDLQFWISYCFVAFAYITLWFSPFRQDDSSMEYLFALTRMRVNLFYVIAALVVAILVNTYLTEKIFFYGLQIGVAVIFIALMIFLSDIDEDHAAKEKKHEIRRSFGKEAKSRVLVLSNKNKDPALARKYDLLLDMLAVVTESKNPDCMEYENKFMQILGDLEDSNGDSKSEYRVSLVEKLIDTLKLRNQMQY